MPEKFEFKYLDGEYIQHMQSIVSNKLHRKHRSGSKDTEKVKEKVPTTDTPCQTNEARQINLEASSKVVPEVLNSEKLAVSLTSEKDFQSRAHITNVRRVNWAEQQRPILNRKPEMRLETADIPTASTLHQQEFDSIETSLAKITCSQRAICSSINLLVPNLMYKPSLETPSESKRYRDRFEAFLRMFTRNYAYPIELMLTDIQSSKSLASAPFIYKINSLYNVLQVAMSAYAINIRNYLHPRVPPKILDLLNSIRQTTNICIERMLFHEDDYIVQVLLAKIDEAEMQLRNIDAGKSDYNLNKVKIVANPRENSINDLSMYASAMIPAKSTAKVNANRKRMPKNDEEIKRKAVVCVICIHFGAFVFCYEPAIWLCLVSMVMYWLCN